MLGCNAFTAQPATLGSVEVRTSSPSVRIEQIETGQRVSIPFTVTNTGNATLYYFTCFYAVEKNTDGSWVPAWNPICTLVLSPPRALEPGASLSDTVEGWDQPHTAPKFDLTNLAPRYRVRVGLFLDNSLHPKRFIPPERSISNEFTITL
jgi:hypothetical protein